MLNEYTIYGIYAVRLLLMVFVSSVISESIISILKDLGYPQSIKFRFKLAFTVLTIIFQLGLLLYAFRYVLFYFSQVLRVIKKLVQYTSNAHSKRVRPDIRAFELKLSKKVSPDPLMVFLKHVGHPQTKKTKWYLTWVIFTIITQLGLLSYIFHRVFLKQNLLCVVMEQSKTHVQF